MSRQAHPLVADHYDDLEQQQESATLGMWAFLATEVLWFGALFTGYAVYRFQHPAGFSAGSAKLDVLLGTINTAVLLTSSLTVALAVFAAKVGRPRMGQFMVLATMVLGVAFLCIKGYEYWHKWHEGHVPGHGFTMTEPGSELFFSFYFVMTGMHATHMIVGLGLFTMTLLLWRRGRITAEKPIVIEMVGLFWHFVDVVWIYLFPLFYLVG
jgi:cytochrome c oxidase subunit 3